MQTCWHVYSLTHFPWKKQQQPQPQQQQEWLYPLGHARHASSVVKLRAGMYLWAKLPFGLADDLAFCQALCSSEGVVLSPGRGFGPGGHGHVRFALVRAGVPGLLLVCCLATCLLSLSVCCRHTHF